MKDTHKVDLSINGNTLTSNASDITLKIDGKRVYSLKSDLEKEYPRKSLPLAALASFLKAAHTAFGHIDRYQTLVTMAKSPMSFTEIMSLLKTTPATTNFHIRKLLKGNIVYKNDAGLYELTLLGELVLEYFSKFLEEANRLQKEIFSTQP